MKKMKKLTVMLMLVCAFAMVLSGCGSSSSDGGASSDAYKVGIIQLIEHPALDEATKGFKEGMVTPTALPSPAVLLQIKWI